MRYRGARISFPVVLVLTSQMSEHDLISHTPAVRLILTQARKTKCSLFIRSPDTRYIAAIWVRASTLNPSLISTRASLVDYEFIWVNSCIAS